MKGNGDFSAGGLFAAAAILPENNVRVTNLKNCSLALEGILPSATNRPCKARMVFLGPSEMSNVPGWDRAYSINIFPVNEKDERIDN